MEVFYGDPVAQEYRDLWVLRFTGDGRCRAFEEWPFWPDRPVTGRADPLGAAIGERPGLRRM